MTRATTIALKAFIAGLALGFMGLACAAVTSVEPQKAWSGRVPLTERPPLQTSIAKESDWTRIWKQCRVQGPAPKVDFQKTLGLVAVRRSSVVKFMSLNLDDGNLRTSVVVTPDMPDYMGCTIVLIKRTGIRKVNGNPVGQ